jgi:hypothetical protein
LTGKLRESGINLILRLDESCKEESEEGMSSPRTVPIKRPLLRVALVGIGLLVFGTAVFFGWTALETYVFAERIHLLTSEKKLRVGMTQEEVENLFGIKAEDRKAPDPNLAATFPPKPHDGVIRYREDRDRNGIYMNYSGWYRGLIVTSQHHVEVSYDPSGRVKEWQRQ